MADKDQIGLTVIGSATMDRVLATGYFSGKDDAAKFAAALAIREGCSIEAVRGAETKWHTGGLDPDGELKTTIRLIYGHATEPYRALESLIDSGLQIVAKHLHERGALVLSDFVRDADQP